MLLRKINFTHIFNVIYYYYNVILLYLDITHNFSLLTTVLRRFTTYVSTGDILLYYISLFSSIIWTDSMIWTKVFFCRNKYINSIFLNWYSTLGRTFGMYVLWLHVIRLTVALWYYGRIYCRSWKFRWFAFYF